ncbi:hypothetical protein BN6_35930 [Saccharothrix espanaensis DSM 44229]|uniref:DUF98 domain-containing protein n=2 Tax=Saccharothrix espanaensis TaxID=103731 RepID=K0K2T5_SACES|nr:hypothetical protein BN6_35930 [Saccharothrix espanaensis DSM 44229]
MSNRSAGNLRCRYDPPADVLEIDVRDLPGRLRALLLLDGTLTTALEAYRLAPVVVEVLSLDLVALDADTGRWLDATPGAPALSRRTALYDAHTNELLVEADTVMLPERLPPAFSDAVRRTEPGIGDALVRLRVAHRRELLWYGRDPVGLVRCHRLVHAAHPVACVRESFPGVDAGPSGPR